MKCVFPISDRFFPSELNQIVGSRAHAVVEILIDLFIPEMRIEEAFRRHGARAIIHDCLASGRLERANDVGLAPADSNIGR